MSDRLRWALAWLVVATLYGTTAVTVALLHRRTPISPPSRPPQRVDVQLVEPPPPEPAHPQATPRPSRPRRPAERPHHPRRRKRPVDLTKTTPRTRNEPLRTYHEPQATPPKPGRPPVFGLSPRSFGNSGPELATGPGETLAASPTPTSTATPQAAPPAPLHLLTRLPEILEEPDPTYPDPLRAKGIEGDVVLELVVDSDGRVRPGSIHVVTASDERFVSAAVSAATNTRFLPAEIDGEAVPARIRLPVRFRLR